MNTSAIIAKRPVSKEVLRLRTIFLSHLLAGQVVPEHVWENPAGHAKVTSWEELICVAFNPDADRVLAVVEIHRPDGYSGMLRRHGSVEYIRFFIDWGMGEGYEPLSLTHFKVSDDPIDGEGVRSSVRKTVSAIFDADRYWGCVLDGIQPKVRAVLSWNQVPELDPEFTPLFGNVIDSVIRVKSKDELKMLMGMQPQAGAVSSDQVDDVIRQVSESSTSDSGRVV